MKTRALIIVAVLAMAAVACGDTADTTTTTPATTLPPATTTSTTVAPTTTVPPTTTTLPPTTTTAAVEGRTFTGADGVEQTVTDTSRIVSLAGDITETLYELGRGDSVAAIDVTTTFPPEATEKPQIGFAQQLAPEPVIGVRPTLVLADEFTAPPEAIEQIRGAGIPVIVLPSQTSFEGVTDKIALIAEIVGAESEGAELVARVESDIQAAVDRAAELQGDQQPKVGYIYLRGPQVLLMFGAGMPTQAMIEGAGGVDAFAVSGIRGAVPLTPEALVSAAPDVLVLPSSVEQLGGVEAFVATPGVAETPAGQTGNILAYDEAYFFNLGPRVGLALQEFVEDLYGS